MEKNPDISTNVENWIENFFLIFHLLISDDCSYWKNRALKVFECLDLEKCCFPFVNTWADLEQELNCGHENPQVNRSDKLWSAFMMSVM